MDAKKIVKKLKAVPKKQNFTFSLSGEVVEELQRTCKMQGVSVSSVVEELMKEFLESVKKR